MSEGGIGLDILMKSQYLSILIRMELSLYRIFQNVYITRFKYNPSERDCVDN